MYSGALLVCTLEHCCKTATIVLSDEIQRLQWLFHFVNFRLQNGSRVCQRYFATKDHGQQR